MSDEQNRDRENDVPQSAAARRIRALGLDREETPADTDVVHGGFWENFWYHHKWTTIFISTALVLFLICTLQMCSQNSYDVYIMYAGPGYMTANQVRSTQDAIKQIMPDYNGDGTRGVMFSFLNYLNAEQIAQKQAQAKEDGVELIVDFSGNANIYKKFEAEVVAGESVIYLLDPELYESVKSAGGLIPLAEILEETPAAAVDEYGLLLAETNLAKTFSTLQKLPEDTILCIRRVSTMSIFKGRAKAEKVHAWHVDLFKQMLTFEVTE